MARIEIWIYPSGETLTREIKDCVEASELLSMLGYGEDDVLVVYNGRIIGGGEKICGGKIKVIEQGVGG